MIVAWKIKSESVKRLSISNYMHGGVAIVVAIGLSQYSTNVPRPIPTIYTFNYNIYTLNYNILTIFYLFTLIELQPISIKVSVRDRVPN